MNGMRLSKKNALTIKIMTAFAIARIIVLILSHGTQKGFVPLLRRDDLFRVPLIHIDRVEVVKRFIPPDSVHICIQSLAGVESVAMERIALPFGQ